MWKRCWRFLQQSACWLLLGALIGAAGTLAGLSPMMSMILAVILYLGWEFRSPKRIRTAWVHIKVFYLLLKLLWHIKRLLKQMEPYLQKENVKG